MIPHFSFLIISDPVFFVSRCGKNVTNFSVPTPTELSNDEANDSKLSVIGAAVEFARSSNLLGIFVDAELLVKFALFPFFTVAD